MIQLGLTPWLDSQRVPALPSTALVAGIMLVLAVTGRPCDTNTGALELATLDELWLELEDDCCPPDPVNDTAMVWLAEIALKV